ncbi:MAG: CarD family transcriptional regulator [Rickettsiaceae bacterium]|nr:CarD family transcriptional regulator [Rickettsiaceae bacterium]
MKILSVFKEGDKVVYPSHGVGEIIQIESQQIAEQKLEFYVIRFIHDRMTLKIPVKKALSLGLRNLVDKNVVSEIYDIIQKKSKPSMNKMWSRRAQEYEVKINSGNIFSVAEVVRDLYKEENERSYSERTIYESALNRLSRELALLENIKTEDATVKVLDLLKDRVAA